MRWCRAAALLLALLLLGSVPSLAQTPVTIIGPVTIGNCVKFFSPVQVQDAGTVCGGAAGSVSSVTNSDSTLTFSPTTGNVIGSLNLAHSNTWTVAQTFAGLTASSVTDTGLASGGTQCVQASTTGLLSGTGSACGAGGGAVSSVSNADGTLTISPTTGAVVASIALGHVNTWTAAQTFSNGITVSSVFTATGLVTLADHAVQAANTVVGNATSLSASPTALALPSCSTAASALNWTTNTGFTCNTSITAAAVPASGLTGTTLASNVVTSSLTTVGTLIGGATGAGFTINFGASTESGILGLANGGTNAALTASNGGVVYSTGSALAILAGTVTSGQCLLSGSSAAPTWGSCTGGAAVSSVSNADGTLTISPTTGAVVASLALGHANTWTAAQTFTNSDILLLGSSTGATTFTSANAGASNFTITFPAATGTVALAANANVASVSNADGTLTISPTTGAVVASIALGHANSWTAAQTFPASGIKLLGSSTGATTFTSANAGASNFTLTLPAVTDTVAVLGTSQTHTATQTFSGTLNVSGTFQIGGTTVALPISLTNGGTNNALTASAGGIVWSDASKLNILAGTSTAGQCLLSGNLVTPSWGACPQTVSSVSNADGTLTISPTTGAVVASIALGHANTWTAKQTISAAGFALSGNISQAAWTTSGVRYANVTGTLTDTSSSGTVATAYTSVFGGDTIAASSATTFTNYYSLYATSPVAGTNVTLTNAWALGADTLKVNGIATITGNLTTNVTGSTQCLQVNSSGVVSGFGGACGAVASVSNADGTLTISPTTGAVVASIALGHANTWTAAQTFPASGIKLTGSSTGVTTLTSANAGASNFTLTLPAVTDTVAVLGTSQTFTATQTFSGTLNASGTFQIGGTTVALPISLTNGGTAAALTASNGGIVYSTASALAILAGTATASQCLLSGSNAAPSWGSCSGGAAVSSVSNADGTLTISPTTGAVVASIALAHANTWTALPTVNIAGIAATSTDGLVIENTTAAAVGAQQWSPRLHYIGQGWKTNATAGSQTVDWIEEVQPVQGAANPSSNLNLSFQINAGGYNALLSSRSGTSAVAAPSVNVLSGSLVLSGNISAPAWTTSGIQYVDIASTLTDTTSSGTVATAYTSKFGGNTIAASSATTFTNYYGSYFLNEVAGTNVTLTNKWALGADSAQINGNLNITGSLQFSGTTVVGPTTQSLTSGTGATYTTAAGAKWIEVFMIGGGGGGAGASTSALVAGSAGGASTFNAVNANGGSGGSGATPSAVGIGGAGGTGGTGTATRRNPGGNGGNGFAASVNLTGGAGGNGYFGGGAVAVSTSNTSIAGNSAVANTGGGGGGAVNNTNPADGGGGGSGEFVYLIINNPAATYTYTVGTSGAGGSSTNNGGNGGTGFIFVIQHFNF